MFEARHTAVELAGSLNALHVEALDVSRLHPCLHPCLDSVCVVCLDKQYATRLHPCLHYVLCEECACELFSRAGAKCPVCRASLVRFETGNFDSTFDSTYLPPRASFPHARDAASLGDFSEFVELLRNGTADCKEHAARALANLAVDAANRVSIVAAGAVAPLIELIRSGTIGCKEQAAAVLANLAANVRRFLEAPPALPACHTIGVL